MLPPLPPSAARPRRVRMAAVLLLVSSWSMAGCGGRDTPVFGPPADMAVARDGCVTFLWEGAPTGRALLHAQDGVALDRQRTALQRAVKPWIKAQGREDDYAASSRAVVRLVVDGEARWHDFLLIAATTAHPELRVWKYEVRTPEETTATSIVLARDPGMTDCGPLVGEILLPQLATSITVVVARLLGVDARYHTRLTVLGTTAFGLPPGEETLFDVPADAAAGDPAHKRVVTHVMDCIRKTAHSTDPDAIRLVEAWPFPEPSQLLSFGEMLHIYRTLRAAVGTPILFERE